MPRCCASINDPNNPANVLVYVDVDAADEKTAKDAAKAAALAAYKAGKFPGGTPAVALKPKVSPLTKAAADAA